ASSRAAHVVGETRRIGQDQLDRLRRIGLRAREARGADAEANRAAEQAAPGEHYAAHLLDIINAAVRPAARRCPGDTPAAAAGPRSSIPTRSRSSAAVGSCGATAWDAKDRSARAWLGRAPRIARPDAPSR